MDGALEHRSDPGPIRLIPSQSDRGMRLDAYLTKALEGPSRTRIREWIEQGRVRIANRPVTRASHRVSEGEPLEVHPPPPLESSILAENLPIEVLYEDEDLAVIFKPAGMPTHPTPSRTTGTLVNALQHRIRTLSGVGGVLRPGIVHRLDRVTSGLLVVAKNDETHRSLADRFKNRQVRKTYRALCLGHLMDSGGVIRGKIERHPTRRQRMRLDGPSGRESETEYRVIEGSGPVLGLLLFPRTGRTHQLRVHLESLHAPIVLDRLYGYEPKRWPYPALNPILKNYEGIFLHAEKLEFDHPRTGKKVSFRVDPPEVFGKVWTAVFGTPVSR